MPKHILALIILTSLFSATACAADCASVRPLSLSDIDAQIGPVRERAYVEYFLGQPQRSVGSFTTLIEIYERAHCTKMPDEVRSAFQYEELVERGRLVRAYRTAGDAAKAATEIKKAVELGQVVFRNGSWSSADLSALIAREDPNIESFVRGAVSGDGR